MEGVIAVFIPIVALLIPIVVILTRHQQRMAELIHGSHAENANLSALVHEVQSLRDAVNRQAIALDELERKALGPRQP